MLETLETGRDAFRRHAWNEAQQALDEAAQSEPLSPEDLQLLAEAWWWSGRPDDALEAWERAYAAYVETGRPTAAAMIAMELAYLAFRRLAYSIGGGWMGRAEELLAREPESAAHGWLRLLHGVVATFGRGDLPEAIAHVDAALALGVKHGNRDVQSLARSIKGIALIYRGEWREGLKLIDEATAAAMAGELNLRAASDIYCNTIAACRSLADYRRAGEWTDEADRWMRRQAVGGYPGICRVHRAELKRLRGLWPEAEQEARHACDELLHFHIMDAVGFAQYEVGEVRLRMGDLVAAEEAFNRAYEYGTDPQPGLALLRLARGEIEEAARSISRSLAGEGGDPSAGDQQNFLERVRLLPAQVVISLAAGDLETARKATEELEDIAGRYESVAIQAAALTARGDLLLMEGNSREAARALGARPATPGEFTMRAFLNGRIDVTQAEAIRDLIEARTAFQAKVAHDQVLGRVSAAVNHLKDRLAEIVARLEASIEFSEEGEADRFLPEGGLLRDIDELRRGIEDLAGTYERGRRVRDGVSVAIVGSPNAGKSSLFNRLLEEDRAIVTAIAGTTRDVLEETLDLRGIPVVLRDTAGLHEPRDEAEAEAVRRARGALAAADLLLLVLDGSRPLRDDERALLGGLEPARAVVAINKADLASGIGPHEALRLKQRHAALEVSAKTGAGIEALRRRLEEAAGSGAAATREETFITNVRHKDLLLKAAGALRRAGDGAVRGVPDEYLIPDYREALDRLGEITGEVGIDGIYERIFRNFCIGK